MELRLKQPAMRPLSRMARRQPGCAALVTGQAHVELTLEELLVDSFSRWRSEKGRRCSRLMLITRRNSKRSASRKGRRRRRGVRSRPGARTSTGREGEKGA